ncbi:MAG: tetratricopeptide repeat protein [Pseudomonadota bacterium]
MTRLPTASALLVLVCLLAAPARARSPDEPVDGGSSEAGSSLKDLSKVRQLLDDILLKQAEESLRLAREEIVQGQLLSALELLTEAQEMAPQAVDVVLELGRLQVRLGHGAEAWAQLQQAMLLAPDRVDVVLAVVDQVLREDVDVVQLEDLAGRLAALRTAQANDPDLIRHQARLASRLERFEQAVQFYREALALTVDDETLVLELGDLFRDHDSLDEALSWYSRVDADGPFGDAARDRMWRVEVELQARRFGWSAGSSAPGDEAALLLERARTLVERRRPREAVALLEQALAQAPGYSEARLLLGDAWRVQGDRQRAELEYLRGLVFDQSSADLHARLGELYLEHVDDNRVQEAIALIGRALQLRPDWIELKLKLAQSLRRSGQLPRALQLVQEYLAAQPPEPGRTQAQALQSNLVKSLSKEGELLSSTLEITSALGSEGSFRQGGLQGLNRARALLARGETAAALATLRHLGADLPDARLRALEGRILHAAGQLDEAALALADSLRLDPGQADVHTQLGSILFEQGQLPAAQAALDQGLALGDAEAALYLGELHLARARHGPAWLSWSLLPDLLRSLVELDVLDPLPAGSALLERRAELQGALTRAAWASALLPLLLVLGVASALAWLLRYRFGGLDLQRFVLRYPDSSAEVKRLLSSIHHEVLKHNTMILQGVAESLRAGQATEAQLQRVRQLAQGGEDSPSGRFRHHVLQLEELARGAGSRLNVRFKDDSIAPIFKGFSILAGIQDQIVEARLEHPRTRTRVCQALERASAALNTDAYLRMQELIEQIRSAPLDASWFVRTFEATLREPGLAQTPAEALQLSSTLEWPLHLSLAPESLQLILNNLFRNAALAEIAEAKLPLKIGLHLTLETHPVTGHVRLALAVGDLASSTLSMDDVRQRPPDRGLGLVLETLQRCGGSMKVRRSTAAWEKEVVVFLPYVAS